MTCVPVFFKIARPKFVPHPRNDISQSLKNIMCETVLKCLPIWGSGKASAFLAETSFLNDPLSFCVTCSCPRAPKSSWKTCFFPTGLRAATLSLLLQNNTEKGSGKPSEIMSGSCFFVSKPVLPRKRPGRQNYLKPNSPKSIKKCSF